MCVCVCGCVCPLCSPPRVLAAHVPMSVVEHLSQAIDCGHLANPGVQRLFVKRYDEAVIDVFGAKAEAENPYAVAQYVRPPPQGVHANCMRIQYDFVDPDKSKLGQWLAAVPALACGDDDALDGACLVRAQTTLPVYHSLCTFVRLCPTSGAHSCLWARSCTA